MKLKKKHLFVIVPVVVIIWLLGFFYSSEQDIKRRSGEQYGKGNKAFNSQEYRDAIFSLNRALEIGLDDYYTFCAYQQIGEAHAKLGENEHAIEAYKKALKTPIPKGFNSNSRYGYVHAFLADVYMTSKQYVEAISEYKQASQFYNSDADHSAIGLAYAQLGQREQAITHCKIAIEKYPDDYTAYQVLGDVYRMLKEHRLAVDTYKKSLIVLDNTKTLQEFKPLRELAATYRSDLHTSLGYSYQNLSDVQSAIDSYKSAIKENAENPYPYFQLARIYSYQRDKQGAMELYKRLTELDDALSIDLLDYIHSLNLR